MFGFCNVLIISSLLSLIKCYNSVVLFYLYNYYLYSLLMFSISSNNIKYDVRYYLWPVIIHTIIVCIPVF